MRTETNGSAWEIRAGRNQTMFRAVNEELNRDDGDHVLTIACECADETCSATIEISRSAYERLREHPNRFVVLDGHVYPEVEDVVESGGSFVVVAKRGEAAAIAEARGPRGE